MPNDYFTLEEVGSILPRVREQMREAMELKRRADERLAEFRQKGVNDPVEVALARGQVEFLLLETRRRVETVRSWGALVKDIDRGLVDFPGWIPGQGYVYLCWKVDEETVSHWHRRSEGFAQRRLIEPALFSIRKDC